MELRECIVDARMEFSDWSYPDRYPGAVTIGGIIPVTYPGAVTWVETRVEVG